jgi:exodeoxyribonuclease V alpha subunit
MLDRLEAMRDAGVLGDLDLRFTQLLGRIGNGDGPLLLGAALTSQWTSMGHTCLDLARVAGTRLGDAEGLGIATPALEDWIAALRSSPAVGRPGDFAPLVLDEAGRLYLYRYWAYEREVAESLSARLLDDAAAVDVPRLRAGLDRLFPGQESPDWQRIAAAAGVLRQFTVIAGGPGTGKTTTVVRLLALLLEQAAGHPFRIALAAPTGKAAARIQDAIRTAKRELPVDAAVREAIPEEAATLHRLLGWRPGGGGFTHGRENPLDADVLVVDEASMVDLAMMAKLLRAVPGAARLILLGDRDQLASVEAGAVLGDICGEASRGSAAFGQRLFEATGHDPGGEGGGPPINDAIVLLRKSYRFGEQSGIGRLAWLVNRGDAAAAFDLLASGDFPDVTWRTVETPRSLAEALAPIATQTFPAGAAGGPEAALGSLDSVRLLCAHRSGPFGVDAVNRLVEHWLRAEGLIGGERPWYRGRPVLVTCNDYHLQLFNGDVGVALPDAEADGALRVFFPAAGGSLRRIPPARLPAHETAYATTVHKSQGTEAERVILILPSEASPVLTRELIYTGITRARARVEIWGARPVFEAAVARRLRRSSGLREALWQGHI